MWPGWALLVLATFAGTKVARLPGRNPATLVHATHFSEKKYVLRQVGTYLEIL